MADETRHEHIVKTTLRKHPEFFDLWQGSDLNYPSTSEGDLAFCRYLKQAGATNHDTLILWMRSSRWRQKCERHDYVKRTIETLGE